MVKKAAVHFTPEAIQDLKKLDQPAAQRVLKKIKWLSENNELATHLPLQNNLKGLFKLRVGDWRVLYEWNEKAGEIVILFVGHRSVIYKR